MHLFSHLIDIQDEEKSDETWLILTNRNVSNVTYTW